MKSIKSILICLLFASIGIGAWAQCGQNGYPACSTQSYMITKYGANKIYALKSGNAFSIECNQQYNSANPTFMNLANNPNKTNGAVEVRLSNSLKPDLANQYSSLDWTGDKYTTTDFCSGSRHTYGIRNGTNFAGGAVELGNEANKVRYLIDYSLDIQLNGQKLDYSTTWYYNPPSLPDQSNGNYRNSYTFNPSNTIQDLVFFEYATPYLYSDQYDDVCVKDNPRCPQSNSCEGWGRGYSRSWISAPLNARYQVGGTYTISVIDQVAWKNSSPSLSYCNGEVANFQSNGRYDLSKLVSLFDSNFGSFKVISSSGQDRTSACITGTGGAFVNPRALAVGNYNIYYVFNYLNASATTLTGTLNIVNSPSAQAQCGSFGGLCAFNFCNSSGIRNLSVPYYLVNATGSYWSGSNVLNGSQFNTSGLSNGTYNINLNVYNTTCTVTMPAFPVNIYIPSVSATNIQSCISSRSFDLQNAVNPNGGTFSYVNGGLYLSGAKNNIFTPSISGLGSFNINYTYTDAGSCSNSVQLNVNVGNGISLDAGPNLTIAGSNLVTGLDPLDYFVLPGSGENILGGTFSGSNISSNGYTGYKQALFRKPGIYNINYTVNQGTCNAFGSKRITVLDILVTTLGTNTVLGCKNSESISSIVSRNLNLKGQTPQVTTNRVYNVEPGDVVGFVYDMGFYGSIFSPNSGFSYTNRWNETNSYTKKDFFPDFGESSDVSSSSYNDLLSVFSTTKRYLYSNYYMSQFPPSGLVKGIDFDIDGNDYAQLFSHGPCLCGFGVMGYVSKSVFNQRVPQYSNNVSGFNNALFNNYNSVCNNNNTWDAVTCQPGNYSNSGASRPNLTDASNIVDETNPIVYLPGNSTPINMNSVLTLTMVSAPLVSTSTGIVNVNINGTVTGATLDSYGVSRGTGSVRYSFPLTIRFLNDSVPNTGSTQTVCINAPMTISGITGVNPRYIVWTPSSPFVATNASRGIGSFTVSGSQSINGYWTNPINVPITAAGCYRTFTKNVFVNPLPNISFPTGTVFGCIGAGTITMTGIPSGGSWSGSGISSNGVYNQTTIPGFYTFTYTYTDGNGCRNSANNRLYQQPASTILGGASFSLCQNNTPIQMATGTPSGGFWTGNGISNGYFIPSIAQLGRNVLTYTWPSGCVNKTDTVSGYVNPIVILTVPSSIISSCNRLEPYDIIGNWVFPVVTTLGYTSLVSGTGVSLNQLLTNSIPTNVGLLNLKYIVRTDKNCITSDSFNVRVNQPAGPPTLTYKQLVCAGDSLKLVPVSTANNQTFVFRYYLNQSTSPDFVGREFKYIPKPNDNIFVETVDNNNCVSLNKTSVTANVDKLVGSFSYSPSSFTPGTLVKFTSSFVDISSYVWDFGDSSSYSYQANPSHYYYGSKDSLTVSVTLKSNLGCTYKVSKKNALYVVSSMGHDGITEMFTVYPVPAEDYLSVKGVSGGEFKVIDLFGNVVISGELNQGQIYIGALPKGVYVFEFHKDGNVKRTKIEKI